MRPFLSLLALVCVMAVPSRVVARTFTDDKGTTTDAELSGVMGADVILRRNGVGIRWPLARLSAADQKYVKEWQANPPATPKLFVRLWEKTGFSPAGTFSEAPSTQPELPNIPGVMEVKKRETFHYYDVDVSNPSTTQANQLSLAYQLYVLTADGSLVVEAGTEALPAIGPQGLGKAETKALSSTRTKTTSLSLQVSRNSVSTGQKRSVSKERFGGGWVRVYSQDGKVVGEAQQLIPEIEQMKPEWVGPTVAATGKVEKLDQFDALIAMVKERLEKIKELLKSLPPLPEPKGDQPEAPPLPPGFPKPPGN
ncbi:hypothetical protein BH09VER1_BH09VER1_40810 [soil metagenome]